MDESMSDPSSEASTEKASVRPSQSQNFEREPSSEYEPQDIRSKIEHAIGHSFHNPKTVVDTFNSAKLLSQYALLGAAQLRSSWIDQNLDRCLEGQRGFLASTEVCESVMAYVHADARLCNSAVKLGLRYLRPRARDQTRSQIVINVEVVQAIIGLAYMDSNRDTQTVRNISHCLGIGYSSDVSERLVSIFKSLIAVGIVPNRSQNATARLIDKRYFQTQKPKETNAEILKSRFEKQAAAEQFQGLKAWGVDKVQADGSTQTVVRGAGSSSNQATSTARLRYKSKHKRLKASLRGKQRDKVEEAADKGIANAMEAIRLGPGQKRQAETAAGGCRQDGSTEKGARQHRTDRPTLEEEQATKAAHAGVVDKDWASTLRGQQILGVPGSDDSGDQTMRMSEGQVMDI